MNRPIPEITELVSLRRMFRVSQESVALAMDSDQKEVSRLEIGSVDPRWSTIQRYREAVMAEIARLGGSLTTAMT